jgi:hypothetical protein
VDTEEALLALAFQPRPGLSDAAHAELNAAHDAERLLPHLEREWDEAHPTAEPSQERQAQLHSAMAMRSLDELLDAVADGFRRQVDELIALARRREDSLRSALVNVGHERDQLAADRLALAEVVGVQEETVALLMRKIGEVERVQEGTMETHRVLLAAFGLQDALLKPIPFAAELELLRVVAGEDPLLAAAIGSIPAGAARDGLATHDQLSARFRGMATQARVAELVPALGGVLSHGLAWVLGWVWVPEDGDKVLAGRVDTEARLARAQVHLAEGNLAGAVHEVDQLEGLPREIAKDWLDAAKARLVTQQAIDIITSHCAVFSSHNFKKIE